MLADALATAQAQIGDLPIQTPEVGVVLVRAGLFVAGFLLVLAIGWLVVVPALARVVTARNRDNPTLQEAVERYARVVVLVVALGTGLGAAGFTRLLGGSALVIAAATLALGVAGQTVIGSLVSGMALVVDPQFNVGNYIRWSEGQGEVRSITLRVTRVETPDGGLVTIPNTTLTDEAITRPFEGGRSRVVERLQVDYADDLDRALATLVDAAEAVESVAGEPSPSATVDELAGDGVVLRLAYWVEDPRSNQLRTRAAVARRVKQGLEEAAVTINPATKRNLDGEIRLDEVETGSEAA